jgi:hypothetical protein
MVRVPRHSACIDCPLVFRPFLAVILRMRDVRAARTQCVLDGAGTLHCAPNQNRSWVLVRADDAWLGNTKGTCEKGRLGRGYVFAA